MIVTKSWLNNFIDLNEISNETLYATLNSIGLEVDNITTYTIPEKIVIGKILSCEKHPDADKLNVCQIDIGSDIRQIVCGAANVVDAQYVAVATIGAKLGEDFEIKHAKLRGVESEGMVCSASELGLPELGDGIMILDDSIGELIVGKELNEYKKLADTVIEIELTANRGDCLSVHGVARDLSAALNLPLKEFEYESQSPEKIGLARVAKIVTEGKIDASVQYVMANIEKLHISLLFTLRLAFVDELKSDDLANILSYITHTTGVIIRAYDVSDIDIEDEGKVIINLSNNKEIINVYINDKPCSQVGINQIEKSKANQNSTRVLFETSYIHATQLVDAVSEHKLETDDLYYNTSRGSEPQLSFGIDYLTYLFETYNSCKLYNGIISLEQEKEDKIIAIGTDEVSQIIGNDIDKSDITRILTSLGFTVQNSNENNFGVTVPKFRHDIENIQDITEEIVRILGIDNIEAKPLYFKEVERINATTEKYYAKKELRSRAIAAGFYENISFAFTDKKLLEKYNFSTVQDKLDIINPITTDLNTLRTTITLNLLQAAQRNVSYSQRRIALFEIGTIFDENRNEKEVLSLIYSGQKESEYVGNCGKPDDIDFDSFVRKLSAILGNFELRTSIQANTLLHPYQSADIILNGRVCGYLTKVHPTASDDFDLAETFIAEIDFNALIPTHINAKSISKFQGVYKDLSLVINKNIPYSQVSTTIKALELPLLNNYYPIDIYEDEKLGDEKSLTLRLFIQASNKTLDEEDIDSTVNSIIDNIKQEYGATLR